MYKVTIIRNKNRLGKTKTYTKLYTSKTAIINLYKKEQAFVYLIPDESGRICSTPSLNKFIVEELVVHKTIPINKLL